MRDFGLLSNHPTLMASQASLLETLPLELRLSVYSHLFFGDGDGTVQLKPRSTRSRGDDGESAILALHEDSLYVARFQLRSTQWPKEIDEAFFRGM